MDDDAKVMMGFIVGCTVAIIVLILTVGFGQNTEQTCITSGCSVVHVAGGTSFDCVCAGKK